MPAPYGQGTTVTHQRTDSQGQPVGAPYNAVWGEAGSVTYYYPVPPGPDTFNVVVGVWNEISGEVVLPSFEYRYGPGATFEARQGNIQTSHGSATAVG